jgi:lipopolysaccharide assembly outer membrane protein LptD (OstA)
MTTGFNLSGNALFYDYFPLEQNEFITRNLFVPDTLNVVNNIIRTLEDLERLAAPGNWSLTMDHMYNKNRRSGAERHDVRNAVNARLTQNWSISYNNYYNMVDRKLVDQGFTVTRDLHCWRITFTYRTFGTFWEYRILLFNIQLPESLRLQQRDRS